MRTIPDAEIKFALSLKASGKSAREIGKILGVSTRAVYTRINPDVRRGEILRKRMQFRPRGRWHPKGELNPMWKGGDVFTCRWCGKQNHKTILQGKQTKYKHRYCNAECYSAGRGHSQSRDPRVRKYEVFLRRMARMSLNKELNANSSEYGEEMITLQLAWEKAAREFKEITGKNITRL